MAYLEHSERRTRHPDFKRRSSDALKVPGYAYFLVSLLLILTVWQWLGASKLLYSGFSTPQGIISESFILVRNGVLAASLQTTLYEIGVAYAITASVGIPIGLLMGRNKAIEYALDPYVTIFLSLPKIAIWPLILFIFGIDVQSKIVLGFILGVFTLIVNVMNGAKNIDPLLVDVAHGFNISRFGLFRKIVLPASLPNILTGLRLSFGRCTSGVVIGEVLGSITGLGRLAADSGEVFNFAGTFVAATVVLLIGFLGTEAIGRASRTLTRTRGL